MAGEGPVGSTVHCCCTGRGEHLGDVIQRSGLSALQAVAPQGQEVPPGHPRRLGVGSDDLDIVPKPSGGVCSVTG